MPLSPPVSQGDRSIGPADAPVTLVEFGDYQCPYCARAHDIVSALVAEFGGRLRYVFRNYPLVQMHPYALPAALVAEAAQGEQFWALHDLLYANQDALDPESLIGYAREVGVSEVIAEQALGGATEDKIRRDMQSGEESGLEGTPTFFINGRRHEGDWSQEALAEALREAAAVAYS